MAKLVEHQFPCQTLAACLVWVCMWCVLCGGSALCLPKVLLYAPRFPDPSGASFSVATSDGEAWGSKLIRVLAALACRPGFAFHPSSSSATLPDGVLGHKQLNPRLLWCGGLAVAEGDLRNSRGSDVDTQCVDVMRCLLTCFTETLYTENALEANKYATVLCSRRGGAGGALLYSLAYFLAIRSPLALCCNMPHPLCKV